MFILSIKPTFRLHLHQDEKRDRKKSERSDGGSQVKSHEFQSHIGIFILFSYSTSRSVYHQLLRFNKVRLAPVNAATNPLNRSVSVSVAAANQPKKPKVSFSRSISQGKGLDMLLYD